MLVATGLSGIGNSVVAIAVPWLVLQRTGNAALAGVVAAAALGPLVISAFFGGALVDRWGRLRSSVGADLLSAAAVAAIPLAEMTVGLSFPLLLVLVAVGAVFDGPGMAAREALRPEVAAAVGWTLERINSRGEAVDAAAAVAGPAVAGTLIALVGPIPTLWVTVVMFTGAAVVSATGLRGVARRAPTAPPTESYLRSVTAGLALVWGDRTLRALTVLAMLLVAFLVPVEAVVLPVFLQQRGDPTAPAAVLAGLGAGTIAGALLYGRFGHRIGRRAFLVGSMSGLGLSLAAFAATPTGGWRIALAALTGIVAGPINPVTAVVLQERTPPAARGRVIGTVTSLALAAAPAGLLLIGPLLQAAGVPVTFLVLGGGCLLTAGLAARSPNLRGADLRGHSGHHHHPEEPITMTGDTTTTTTPARLSHDPTHRPGEAR